jgi:hypothetical protein
MKQDRTLFVFLFLRCIWIYRQLDVFLGAGISTRYIALFFSITLSEDLIVTNSDYRTTLSSYYCSN